MGVIFENEHSVTLGSQAFLIEEGRELAWAEKHVKTNQAYRWLLSNFVEADRANDNGHIFPLQDLEETKDTLTYAPLNMLHRSHYNVGVHVASEMIYPLDTGGSVAAAETMNPILESLSAFWAYYFPEEMAMVEKAHAEGSLYTSMEAIPEKVGCPVCEKSFAYDGRNSPTYCADLATPGSQKLLHKPHFTAGAVLIPPVRPGWKKADIKELSELLETYAVEAEATYASIAAELPHLEARQWEDMMLQLVVYTSEFAGGARKSK